MKGYSSVRGEKTGFYEQIQQHLDQLVWQLTADAQQDKNQPKSKQSKTTTPTLPDGYCVWLQKQCADIDLLGLRIEHGQAVRLNHVYVPLTTTAPKAQIADTENPEEMRGWREIKPPALLLQMLDEKSLYVSGAPGSGKSTFSRWVTWLACAGAMPAQEIEPPKGYRDAYPLSLQKRLPLWVRLRDFWMFLPETPGAQDLSQAEFEVVLAAWIE